MCGRGRRGGVRECGGGARARVHKCILHACPLRADAEWASRVCAGRLQHASLPVHPFTQWRVSPQASATGRAMQQHAQAKLSPYNPHLWCRAGFHSWAGKCSQNRPGQPAGCAPGGGWDGLDKRGSPRAHAVGGGMPQAGGSLRRCGGRGWGCLTLGPARRTLQQRQGGAKACKERTRPAQARAVERWWTPGARAPLQSA